MDGKQIPQVYVKTDIDSYVAGTLKEPSPVTKINEQDAVTFLKDWAELGNLHDPDALYNLLFFSPQSAASTPGWRGFFGGSGGSKYIWPGPDTRLEFQNRSTASYHTTARVIGDFTGVTDAASFYEQFCTGKHYLKRISDATTLDTSSDPKNTKAASPPGFPRPAIESTDNQVSGYFLNSSSTSDVAVLSLLSFYPKVPANFQNVVQAFLTDARAAGKRKLVIDVSANGGGSIIQGYDTFRQLFPQDLQDGYTRFRHTEALQLMADHVFSKVPGDYSPKKASEKKSSLQRSELSIRSSLNVHNRHFSSVKDKFGPVTYNGDNFTEIIRWNLDKYPDYEDRKQGLGIVVTGYGSRRRAPQHFAQQDIVILFDGNCASTCAIFSEFMRQQAGVNSIVVGGRPSKDPMQAVVSLSTVLKVILTWNRAAPKEHT
jgi:hypothetical protein